MLGGNSQGQWISARVEPDTWPAAQIVIESLTLDGVAIDLTAPTKFDASGVTVKFPRAPFASRPSGNYDVVLRGRHFVEADKARALASR